MAKALLSEHSDIHSHDAFSKQKNDGVYEQMISTVHSLLDNSEDPFEGAPVLDKAVYAPVYSGPSLICQIVSLIQMYGNLIRSSINCLILFIVGQNIF